MTADLKYRKLLAKYAPQPIRSAQDYRRTLKQLDELMQPRADQATSLLIEMLSTLIEKYESRSSPQPTVSPAEMLAHLLEARQLKSAKVAKATKIPAATLSNVLANRRGISKLNALRLGAYFGVSPVLFLDAPMPPDALRAANELVVTNSRASASAPGRR